MPSRRSAPTPDHSARAESEADAPDATQASLRNTGAADDLGSFMVSEVNEPSSQRLLELLNQARDAITESQKHWSAIQHLTGDRRNQRRYQELLALLDAIVRDTESTAATFVYVSDA